MTAREVTRLRAVLTLPLAQGRAPRASSQKGAAMQRAGIFFPSSRSEAAWLGFWSSPPPPSCQAGATGNVRSVDRPKLV